MGARRARELANGPALPRHQCASVGGVGAGATATHGTLAAPGFAVSSTAAAPAATRQLWSAPRCALVPPARRGLVIAMCWTYRCMWIHIVNILAMLALLVMGILTLSQLQSSINALVRATRGVRY